MPAAAHTPIRLYSHSLSGHSHRVHLFLTLLELPFDMVEVDLRAGAQKRPEFLALNPLGQIPVIIDGDTVLTDSNAILIYLAKRHGGASWLPEDALGAAAVQRWLTLAAGPVYAGPCSARLVTVFGAPLDLAAAQGVAVRLFQQIEAEFATAGKPYAAGQAPTIADVAAYAYIAHAPEGGVSLEPYPLLRAWLRRVEALPGFIDMPVSKVGLLAE